MHLLWGGTSENGVTAQENAETATTIPTTGMKITEGGNYEIPEEFIPAVLRSIPRMIPRMK